MPRHLAYLVGRLAAAGGTIETAAIGSLDQAAADAAIVINCAGLGARDLASDPTVFPVRGQHVIVTNPGLTDWVEADTGDSPDLIAIYPHGPHAILRGTAQTGHCEPQPDDQTAHTILQRCTRIEPRPSDAQIIGHRVGHRPTRPTVRVEAEHHGSARIIHNYGHGGAGYTLSWGCAQAAAEAATARTD